MYLFEHFDVVTDNMAVLYLRSKANISKREARWVEYLADFDFTVHHRPGRSNIDDPLSRRTDLEVNRLEYSLDIHPDTANLIAIRVTQRILSLHRLLSVCSRPVMMQCMNDTYGNPQRNVST